MRGVEPISQAAAKQRAGRCGRVANGVCIRLYSEDDFAKRPAFTDPELLRSSLASVILRAKNLGLGEVADFPFLDPPSARAIADGYALLVELGAVDDSLELTDIGKELARPEGYRAIHRALTAGLLGNVGMRDEQEGNSYTGARGIKFWIHPGSWAKKAGRWVAAGELVETTRLFARTVAAIEPRWLEEIGAHLIRR